MSQQALVWLNGKITPPEEAKVSVMDRGFLFGDGVYEAGRSYEGRFLFLEEHWERFRKSASKLLLDIPWSDAELTESLHAVAKEFGDPNVCFRSIVSRGSIPVVGLDVEGLGEPTLAHIIQPVPGKFSEQRKTGAQLLTSTVVRNASDAQDPNIKTSNYLNSLLAQQDVASRGKGEAIMLNANGHVTEGTNFSLFGVTQAGKVITPSLKVGILDSITRRHVLTLDPSIMEEGEYTLEEFQNCAEIFIVSSTREIMPVVHWDDKRYSVAGGLTEKLHGQLLQVIHEYTASRPSYSTDS